MVSSYIFIKNTFIMTPSAMLSEKCFHKMFDKKVRSTYVILHTDQPYYCRHTLALRVII